MRKWTGRIGRRLAACAGLALGALTLAADAGAPPLKTQGSPYYRFMLGDFEITVLLDGVLPLQPLQLLQNIPADEVRAHLERAFTAENVPTSVNAFLVNTGSRMVMIDAGTGSVFGPSLGKLRDSLAASGYKPEQIDDILVTHMHGDHIGGLTIDGKRVFPNATVHADQHDAAEWLDAQKASAASKEMKGVYTTAQGTLDPYVKAGKFKPFDADVELFPGIKALAARGHTPGHSIYSVESKGQKLVLWGDLIHVAAVQFEKPGITVAFDKEPTRAAAARKAAFEDAAKNRTLVGSAHLSFPGLGHLRPSGEGFVFVPIDYDPVH
ncbi:MAG TPA: MBL fold metallo-hydrolase [Nevskiaceae bacterium]|nr:MBL fold metallo-hydrolase [Nevskiaceae bacterium]